MSLLTAYTNLGTGSCCSTSRHNELNTIEKNKDILKFTFWAAQLSVKKPLFSEYPSQCKKKCQQIIYHEFHISEWVLILFLLKLMVFISKKKETRCILPRTPSSGLILWLLWAPHSGPPCPFPLQQCVPTSIPEGMWWPEPPCHPAAPRAMLLLPAGAGDAGKSNTEKLVPAVSQIPGPGLHTTVWVRDSACRDSFLLSIGSKHWSSQESEGQRRNQLWVPP